jgi:hypothetical protein
MTIAPPRGLAELLRLAADAGGLESAIRLAKAFGGKRVYIPKQAPDNHPLVLAGGRAAADAIVKAIGGENIVFPKRGLDARRMLALQRLIEGASTNEAVAASGLGHCQIKRLRAELRNGGAIAAFASKRATRPRDPCQLDIEDWLAAE